MSYLTSLKQIQKLPIIRQLGFMLGLSASVIIGMVLYNQIQEPNYQTLDYQVNSQNIASIVDVMDKNNIRYKIDEKRGMLLVASEDTQKARIKLSASGVPKDDGMSYMFLNANNSFGDTQFIENVKYLRALESDLAKTISAIEGISSAKVHIAMPQNNLFSDENNKPTASIVVWINPAMANDQEKIRSIVGIVSGSVIGLDPKDISLTDQYGHLLSNAFDQQGMRNLEELNYQNKMQNYYEKRIETLIEPLVGDNKAHVRVNVNLDFTQEEEANEKYDPDQKVVRSEQTVSEQSASANASGVPGGLSKSPPSDSKSGGQASGSQDHSESMKNYEIGRSVSYKKSSYAKVKNITVAVVLDNDEVVDSKTNKATVKPIEPEKLNKVTDLIKASIGFDEKRGDKITVVNSPFKPQPIAPIVVPDPLWKQPMVIQQAIRYAGIALLFLVFFALYRKINRFTKDKINMIDQSQDPLLGAGDNQVEMQKLKMEQIKRLKEMAARDPNSVAVIMKNWLGNR